MVTFHQAFVFSHCKSFYLLDQIQSNCVFRLHLKSEKNRTEPNELDELKCSKSLNQTTSYAHWHAFLYLHAHIKTFIYLSHIKSEKKTELNELNELEYSKTLSQLSSYTPWHAFLYLHAQTCIKTFIHLSHLKSEKKDWAKWARWARMLKNTLTDKQLCS